MEETGFAQGDATHVLLHLLLEGVSLDGVQLLRKWGRQFSDWRKTTYAVLTEDEAGRTDRRHPDEMRLEQDSKRRRH